MKLYFAPGACSLAVHIALREAGLDATLMKVDLMNNYRLEDGTDFRSINPRAYVPLLELDDGSRHTEAAALLQYLADKAPAAKLLPANGTDQRLEALEWLAFVSTELHKVFSPWLWHKETADSTRKAVKDKLALRFAELNQRLGAQDWLVKAGYTVADAYAFTIISWAPMLGISLAPYPHLASYLKRVKARPAVQAALKAEGLPAD